MPDLFDHIQQQVAIRERDPAIRANRAAHRALNYDGVAPGRNAFSDAIGSAVDDSHRDSARDALEDAKYTLRSLKREDAHPRDIADAREAVEAARDLLRSLS